MSSCTHPTFEFRIGSVASFVIGGTLLAGFGDASAATKERFVVYSADQDVNDVIELYRADLKTGEVKKISGTMVADGDLGVANLDGPGFRVDAKGKFAVYLADQLTNDKRELFRADFKTGTVTRLNGNLPSDGDVFEFQIDPKGKFVIYTADQDSVEKRELYKVDLSTLAVTKLNPPIASNRDILDIQIDAKGKSIFYCADVTAAQQYELYRYDIESQLTTKLSGPLVAGGSLHVTVNTDGTLGPPYRLDTKGKFAVYRADQTTNDKLELYKVDFATGSVTKLNGPLPSDGDLFEYQIDPKGKFVVYSADQDGVEKRELYKVDLASLEVTKLNQPLISSGDVFELQIDPKSKFVAYRANVTNSSRELYKVDLKTLEVTQLNATLPVNGSIDHFELRGPAKKAFYLGDQIVQGVKELFSVTSGADQLSWLNADAPLVTNGDITDFAVDAKGKRVVYRADRHVDEQFELFVLDVKSGDVIKINETLVAGGDVWDFSFTP